MRTSRVSTRQHDGRDKGDVLGNMLRGQGYMQHCQATSPVDMSPCHRSPTGSLYLGSENQINVQYSIQNSGQTELRHVVKR